MSILNQHIYLYSSKSLFNQVQEEMIEGGLASTIINNRQKELFEKVNI